MISPQKNLKALLGFCKVNALFLLWHMLEIFALLFKIANAFDVNLYFPHYFTEHSSLKHRYKDT